MFYPFILEAVLIGLITTIKKLWLWPHIKRSKCSWSFEFALPMTWSHKSFCKTISRVQPASTTLLIPLETYHYLATSLTKRLTTSMLYWPSWLILMLPVVPDKLVWTISKMVISWSFVPVARGLQIPMETNLEEASFTLYVILHLSSKSLPWINFRCDKIIVNDCPICLR